MSDGSGTAKQEANTKIHLAYEQDHHHAKVLSEEDAAWNRLFEKLGSKSYVSAYVQRTEPSELRNELLKLGHPDTLTDSYLSSIKTSFAAKTQQELEMIDRCNRVVDSAGGLDNFAALLNTENTGELTRIIESLGLSDDDFVD